MSKRPRPLRNEKCLRTELCDAIQRLDSLALLPAASGNLSARLDENAFIITPSGTQKRLLTPPDLIEISLNGDVLRATKSTKPSIEWKMHSKIYSVRPDVKAIVHSHPYSVKTLALLDGELDFSKVAIPEEIEFLGAVIILPVLQAGSDALADALKTEVEAGRNTLILKAHGAVTLGDSILQATARTEILDNLSKALLFSR
ncbi:MAG: class II aldolase/adducin family protein [Myxococcota bacterium]